MKKARAWIPSVLWMGVIFAMSAMPGDVSGAQSGFVMETILPVLTAITGIEASALPVDTIHLLVRKGAHMAEYAVLFWLYAHALKKSGAGHPHLYALLMSVAYAATDELHQAFVDARGPSAVDVMIDTAGAAAAWGCVRAIGAVRARLRRRAAA